MKFKKWTMFRSTRTRSVLRWCRYPFLILGLFALGYYGYVFLDAKAYQAYETWRFQQALKRVTPSNGSSETVHSSLPAAVPPGTETSGLESQGTAGREGSTVGRIEISSLGLSVMVLEGTNGRTLRRGVGHISGTALPGEQGNIGIAGHRDTFFRPLRNIHKDDEITLTTLKGVDRYRVDSIELVEPNEMSVLDNSGDAILTLVTCYPFYFVGPAPKRFVVRAARIPERQASQLLSEPPAKSAVTADPQ
jgi:sortase A